MSKVIPMKRKKKKDSTGRILLLIVLCLVAVLIFAMKLSKIEETVIEGSTIYTDAQIKQMLKIGPHSNIVQVYMASKSEAKKDPFIDHMDIAYLSFNKIKISVHEEQVIGYIDNMGVYFCIDQEGYIIDSVDETKLKPGIAIIEGLKVDALVLKEKVDIPKDILDTCLAFHDAEDKYGIHIDVITFNEGDKDKIHLKIGNKEAVFEDTSLINQKMKFVTDMILQLPLDETGTIYLDDNGTKAYYEKNIQE